MTKIVFNGAGSVTFTKELVADILGFEELAGCTIALHDIDPDRLDTAAAMARWTADALGAKAIDRAVRRPEGRPRGRRPRDQHDPGGRPRRA